MQFTNDARPRAGHLDERLVRLHLRERLVLFDAIARRNLPANELGFRDALAEVGQNELRLVLGLLDHQYAASSSIALLIRGSSGKYSNSSL